MLTLAIKTEVAFSVCPEKFTTFFTYSFPQQLLLLSFHLYCGDLLFREDYSPFVAHGFACSAATNTSVGSCHNCFSVLEGEHAFWTVFYAAGFAVWCAAVAFFWEYCRIPECASFSHNGFSPSIAVCVYMHGCLFPSI